MAKAIHKLIIILLISVTLGWMQGITIQPLYPNAGNIISGTYPLMAYATESNVTAIDSMYAIVKRASDDGVIQSMEMTKVQNDSSGIWVATFNTNTVSTPDGSYKVTFLAKDDDAEYDSATVSVSIQNGGTAGGPVFSDISLNSGDMIAGNYVLTFRVAPLGTNLDSSSIKISLDGGAAQAVDSVPDDTGGVGADTLKTMTEFPDDGVHTLRLQAKDKNGTVLGYSDLIVFNVNNRGRVATVVITGPSGGRIQSDTATITFSISAPSLPASATVDSAQITVDGVNWTRTNNLNSHKLFTGNLPDGGHLVRVKAFASNGTVGHSNPITLITNNKPVVSITSPAGGAVVSGDVIVTFTSTSPANIPHSDSILLDGQGIDTSATSTTYTLATATLEDGAHTLQIKATDANGKTGWSNSLMLQFKNSPSITLESPKADSLVSGKVLVTFTPSPVPPSSVDSVQIAVDGGDWRKTSGNDTDTLDTQGLSEGAHLIQLKVFASNGKTATSRQVKINVLNKPTVRVSSPVGGDTLSGNVTFRFATTPVSPATIAVTEISIDGNPFTAAMTDTSHEYNTIVLADGSHTMTIKATDNNNKVGMSSEVLFFTKNMPMAVISAPTADSMVTGTLDVEFTVTLTSASDSITTTQIAVDGGDWENTDSDSTHELDTRGLSEGAHSLQIKAVNNNGKTGFSRMVEFSVKNQPNVAITEPAVDEIFRDSAVVAFSASAAAPDSIVKTEISIGGGGWVNTSGSAEHKFDTRDYKDGNLRVQIRVTDGSSKQSMSRIREMVVDNSAPKLSLHKVQYTGENTRGRKGAKVMVSALVFDLVAGLDADSGVVFFSDKMDTAKAILLLHDDGPEGEHGDRVKGDNVFTTLVEVNSDSTGEIAFSLRARDAVGNDTAIWSAVALDNTAPEVSYAVTPEPKGGDDKRNGEVYSDKVLMKGSASDVGGGLELVRVTVRNHGGEHVNNSPMAVEPDKGEFSRILNLVPGKNVVTLLARDKAGNADSLQSTVTYLLPKVTEVATPGKETEVAGPNRSKVVIPANALHHATEITMRVVDQDEEPKPLNDNIRLLGVPHEFGPEGMVFRKPVTITLAYTDLDLDPDQDMSPDFRPEDLVIYFWDGSGWLQAGESLLDKEGRTVSVSVNHFTLYDIGIDTSGGTAVSDEFIAYWKHNPVKETEGSTFVINVPRSGRLSMSIFDMAGDLVNRLLPEREVERGNLSPVWDGDNVNGTFAGAGLYIYVLRYESSDGEIEELVRKPVGLIKK